MKSTLFLIFLGMIFLFISCSGSTPTPSNSPKVEFAGFVREEDRAVPSGEYRCKNITEITDEATAPEKDVVWFLVGNATSMSGYLSDETVKKIACDRKLEKPDGYKRFSAGSVFFYVKRKALAF